jgi:hypothetical protein
MCSDRKSPDNFGAARLTWEDVYHMYTNKVEYVFPEPIVKSGTIIAGHVYESSLLEFLFAPKVWLFVKLTVLSQTQISGLICKNLICH